VTTLDQEFGISHVQMLAIISIRTRQLTSLFNISQLSENTYENSLKHFIKHFVGVKESSNFRYKQDRLSSK